MAKGPSGVYEGDYRFKGLPRLHLSLRTARKLEADPRHAAVRRLFREAKGSIEALALLEQLRDRALSVERLESMVRQGLPLVPERPAEPDAPAVVWPTFDKAAADYLLWIQGNENRRDSTHLTARAQIRKAAAFEYDGVRMGSLALDRIPSVMLEAYQRRMLEQNPTNTVTAYLTRVSALYRWVQRRENRAATEARRPANILPVPVDPDTAARGSSSRDRWLSRVEAERLLAATPDRLHFAVAAGLFGGFRIGEVLRMRTAADVDLEIGTLAVREQPDWSPKTARAVRVVPIAPPLLPIVKRHLEQFASPDWMMPALEDPAKPFAYATFNVHFERIVKAAELTTGRRDPRGVVFHTLRHTFASWLVKGGVDLYTVAQLLGDTLQTVEKVYAHLSPESRRRAVEVLAGAMTMPWENDTQSDTQTLLEP